MNLSFEQWDQEKVCLEKLLVINTCYLQSVRIVYVYCQPYSLEFLSQKNKLYTLYFRKNLNKIHQVGSQEFTLQV